MDKKHDVIISAERFNELLSKEIATEEIIKKFVDERESLLKQRYESKLLSEYRFQISEDDEVFLDLKNSDLKKHSDIDMICKLQTYFENITINAINRVVDLRVIKEFDKKNGNSHTATFLYGVLTAIIIIGTILLIKQNGV